MKFKRQGSWLSKLTLLLVAILALTNCATLTRQSAAVTSKPDPINCPPAALELCDVEQPLGSTSLVEFKGYTKGLIVDYGICRTKQKALADCINDYVSKH